ncbi:MAG: hypothetical protein WC350_04745 [Candidatus Micrarchaeia archaeon]|jgi:hypothetical protein
MQRGKPFFVPQPGHKEDVKKKKKQNKPKRRLNEEYIASMNKPLAEPPAREVKVRPPKPVPSKPLRHRVLDRAVKEVMGTGRLKQQERHHVEIIVGELAEGLRNIQSHDVGSKREEVFRRLVEISLYYPDPLRVLGWFIDTYTAIARMDKAERDGKVFPVGPESEADAKKMIDAYSRFTNDGLLYLLLMWVQRENTKGISKFPIQSVCISLEMLKRVTGESQGETHWGKIPDSPYFRA